MKIILWLQSDLEFNFKESQIHLKKGANVYTHSDKNLIDYFIAHNDKHSYEIYVNVQQQLNFDKIVVDECTYYKISKDHFAKYFNRLILLDTPVQTSQDILIESHVHNQYVSLDETIKKALEQNWLIKTPVTGQYIYTQKWLTLIEFLKKSFETIVLKSAYAHIKLPHLVPLNQLLDTGHICTITPEIYFLSKFKTRDFSFKPKYASFYLQNSYDKNAIFEDLELSTVYFTHNCCSGLWPSIKNTSNAFKVVDLQCWSLRNEGGAANNQERLESFSRIQVIAADSPEKLQHEYDQLYANLKQFYHFLKLPFEIVKTSSWYKTSVQNTYDFNVVLDKKIEVSNISYLEKTFTSPYNIKVNGARAHSLCSGTGLQRLAFVFLAVNSFDLSKWYVN